MLKKVMSYELWVMGLVMLLSFPSAGCYAQNKDNKEKAPDPFVWDFGQIKEGEVLKHDFILKNESQKKLNINDITTSCGCTVSQVKKKALLPGESTFIEVQFKSKGYSGAAQQFVYVHTDSIDNPVIRYIIKTDVVK